MINIKIKRKNFRKKGNHFYIKKIYNIYSYDLYIILLCLILIFFTISIQRQNTGKIGKLTLDSEIFLTIKGTGNQPILNNKTILLYDLITESDKNYSFNELPSEILVNGNNVDKIDFYVYNLTLDENYITIRYNKTLTNCNVMFYGLSNITKISFKMLDFSGTNMTGMFGDCSSLISLDLNNFNSLSVTNMAHMFYNCSNLISLNLSNLNTLSVTNMYRMFKYCNSLISLDLSNFNTSSVIIMRSMFNHCIGLKSLDLSNFNSKAVTNMRGLFYECINLISLNLSNFNTKTVTDMREMFKGCNSLISLDLRNFDTSSVTNINNMFLNCNNNLVYCINNNTNSTKLFNHIYTSSYTFKNNNICSHICFDKNKKIILDTKQCVLNCTYNYTFEYNNICYSSCPNGTHNISNNLCLKDIEYNNISYSSCPNGTHNMSNDLCLKDIEYNNISYSSCPNGTHNISNNLCLKDIEKNNYDNYNDYFNNIIKQNNNSNLDDIIINIEKELINNNLDIFIESIIIKENKDLLIKEDNIIYQLTSSYNQKNNNYTNISTINLDECENKLRVYYNIDNNTELIILKIDIFDKGLLIPIIEYKVYNSKTKEILNLTICKDIKIDISIPVNIDENNIFKYNPQNEYYNDICYSFTENNTDIILKDRRNEYINNNLSLCEKNCKYNKYDYNYKKVLCECFIKIDFPLISKIEINKDKLLSNFKDIKNILNINIIKCFKEVFNIEGLKNNIGNYIMSSIILIIIILLVLFKIKGYIIFINEIKEIINNKNKNKSKIFEKKINNNQSKKQRRKRKIKTNLMITNDEINSKLEKNSKINIMENNNNCAEKNLNTFYNKNKINYNDYELNHISYKEALKLDKRSFFEYYLSLLKMKHLIVFTFFTKNDYNSKIIKIILFFFSFALYFTINTLFLSDHIIHKIHEDQGKFNFIYQIPNILYSSIISLIINTIIKYFSLTEKDILEIKYENNNIIKKSAKLIKYLIIKFIIFFILIFLFLILFWYYIICFCTIYKNTQIHLIKDAIISFGLSLLYPFALNLLPGIFRIPSLKYGNKECLFKTSKLIQSLI